MVRCGTDCSYSSYTYSDKLVKSFPMKFLYPLLLCSVSAVSCNQLDKLISFVKGGVNPAGRSIVSPTHTEHSGALPSPASARSPIIAPIPFSELADPTRGVVDIDVPQPKPQGFDLYYIKYI